MTCSVHIGDEFRSVPAQVRKKLARLLGEICNSLDSLDRGPLLESLVQSSLAVTVGLWRFRYEFRADRSRIIVTDAFRLA